MHHPTDRITHTMAFVTRVVEHWLEREIAQWMQITESEQKIHNASLKPSTNNNNNPQNPKINKQIL